MLNNRGYHGGCFGVCFDIGFCFCFGQLFQSSSRAALKILVVFVSVSPWLTSVIVQTLKYISKELFQLEWYDGFVFHSPAAALP